MSCIANLTESNKCSNAVLGCDYVLSLKYENTDLTGSTLSMQIQALNTDVDLLALGMSAQHTTGFYFDSALTGDFTLTIKETDIDILGEGTFDYMIKITDSAGIKTLFMSGKLQVKKAI
jgi:hypothetical protein